MMPLYFVYSAEIGGRGHFDDNVSSAGANAQGGFLPSWMWCNLGIRSTPSYAGLFCYRYKTIFSFWLCLMCWLCVLFYARAGHSVNTVASPRYIDWMKCYIYKNNSFVLISVFDWEFGSRIPDFHRHSNNILFSETFHIMMEPISQYPSSASRYHECLALWPRRYWVCHWPSHQVHN